MKLKHYQQRTLNKLTEFLEQVPEKGAAAAFRAVDPVGLGGDLLADYEPVEGLADVPYVCLRLPTGGGKTLLAAHSVDRAAPFLRRDHPLVLWLVPTLTIRKQTVEALKNRSHAYRRALDVAFQYNVGVYDQAEVFQLRPKDLSDRVCVIVATLQSLRTTSTEGRKLYETHEELEPHFSGLNTVPEGLETGDDERPVMSFVNLMRLHRPMVILDEAHKARTALSLETMQRLNPALVLELTATPNPTKHVGVNILHSVFAAELEAEEMIKLPVELTEHQQWTSAVAGTLRTLKALQREALGEAEYLRPVALFQAQKKGQEVTVDVLKRHLIESEGVAPERIAVATGEQRELDAIDLLEPGCKVDCIITVEALKEGWDCPFAYVLCSIAEVRSATSVEQLLGRVLRMPYARRRRVSTLNRAYAHVVSEGFADAALFLRDRMVEGMGFEKNEAERALRLVEPDLGLVAGAADRPSDGPPPYRVPLQADDAPFIDSLPPPLARRASIQERDGRRDLVIVDALSPKDMEQVTALFRAPRRGDVRGRLETAHRSHYAKPRAADMGETLVLPRLCLRLEDGALEPLDQDLAKELSGASLADCPPELSEDQFSIRVEGDAFLIGLDDGQVTIRQAERRRQLDLGLNLTGWTEGHLVRWLDRALRRPEFTQLALRDFLSRVLRHLQRERDYTLEQLVMAKYQLRTALRRRLDRHLADSRRRSMRAALTGELGEVLASFAHADSFVFTPHGYAARKPYPQPSRFPKHLYAQIDDLRIGGEEEQVARAIDLSRKVVFWVRNIPKEPKRSFWLPTIYGLFYPDFVAKLTDGRAAVIEYKGGHLDTADEAVAKRRVGELWAEKSGGRCLFIWLTRNDAPGRSAAQQLNDGLAAAAPAGAAPAPDADGPASSSGGHWMDALEAAADLSGVGERARVENRAKGVATYWMDAARGPGLIRELPDGTRQRVWREHGREIVLEILDEPG